LGTVVVIVTADGLTVKSRHSSLKISVLVKLQYAYFKYSFISQFERKNKPSTRNKEVTHY